MRRLSWMTLAALLCAWVLSAEVFGDFRAVRHKLLRTPPPPQRSLSLPLDKAAAISDPYLVLVYRVRNTGPTAVTVSARVGDRILRQSSIEPGAVARIDLAWPRPDVLPPNYRVDLQGTTNRWLLEYAELANLHGFTRGAIEFVVLPPGQPFIPPPAWTLFAGIALGVAAAAVRPVQFGRRSSIAYAVLSGLVVALFAAAAMSPLVSEFRVALAPHTFVGGVFLLAVPHVLTVLRIGCRSAAQMRTWIGRARAIAGARLTPTSTIRAALMAGCAAYGLLLWMNVGAYAGGSDQSGYLHTARLLAQGRVSTPVRTLTGIAPGALPPAAYMPLGFRSDGTDTLTPTYPIGLPLMIAAVAHVTGWDSAADYTMVLHALAGVLLIFWLARECGLSASLSMVAALLLAASPLYLFMSLTLMSDTPALVWTTAAVLLAWRSRRRAWWALAAGTAISMAVLVRPANLLVFVPMAVCLGASPARWLLMIAGGVPGAALLFSYNLAAYGSAFTTGYSDHSRFFDAANLIPGAWHYAQWLPVLLTPVGVLAVGVPMLTRRARPLGTVLLVWILAFLVFYAFYAHTHRDWWFLRFVLPAFPPLIIGSVWVGRVLLDRMSAGSARAIVASRMGARAWAVVLAVAMVSHSVWWGRHFGVLESGDGERKYFDVAEWSRSHLPKHAAIVAMQASGALFYYTDFPILRWDFLEPETFRHLEAETRAGRQPLYAVLFPFDIESNAFRDHLPGRWVQVGAIHDISVWQFTGLSSEIQTASAPARLTPIQGAPVQTSSSATDQ